MEVAYYVIFGAGCGIFGGMVGYSWGRRNGGADQIRRDIDRTVEQDLARTTSPKCRALYLTPPIVIEVACQREAGHPDGHLGHVVWTPGVPGDITP